MIWPRAPRRGKIIAGTALGLLVVAGGLFAAHAAGFLLHDSATPASVGAAVEQFRAGGAGAGTLAGVYSYRTRGEESLDALGGARHRYPATTTVTVTGAPCGVGLRWASLEQRSTTWTLCTTSRGIELRGLDQVHRFFGQNDRTTYACRGALLLPVAARMGASSPFTCRSKGGGEEGTVRIVGRETLTVGGKRLHVLHVRTLATVTGSNSGTERVDWWFEGRRPLPVRVVLESRTSRKVIVGRVHYRENATLQLLSLTPRR